MKRMKYRILIVVVFITLFSISSFSQTDNEAETSRKRSDKITVEQLVSKHLSSIGTPDALAAIKSLIAVGTSSSTAHPKTIIESTGVAQLASEGDKSLIAMVFNSTFYPYEKVGYNGQDLYIKFLPEGKRSALGDFLKSHSVAFKEGLFGGTLSSAWALRNLDSRNPKLSYSGIQKINDVQMYKVKYIPHKGSNLTINLFFDVDTFRHLRTEYEFSLPPQIGTDSTQAGRLQGSRFELTEEFSDFKKEGNLTLPHTYKISYITNTQSGTTWLEWNLNLSRFVFNQPINDEAFSELESK